jgi:putative ATP-binding cassette transporter
MAYPLKVEHFSAQKFADALDRLGLRRLAPMLDVPRRWDRELSEDEQQGLMFARLLLHAPRWVLIDEVIDSLDEETRTRALDIFSKDLKDTAVIHIGRTNGRDPAFKRVLHLIKDPTTRRLVREKASERRAPQPGIRAATSS